MGKVDGTGRKALHHGTMLLKVDTSSVQKYLHPNKQKLISKGVDSVKARIENLTNLRPELTHDILCKSIIDEFKSYYSGSDCVIEELNLSDLKKEPKINEVY